jgi:hypothetical protein
VSGIACTAWTIIPPAITTLSMFLSVFISLCSFLFSVPTSDFFGRH